MFIMTPQLDLHPEFFTQDILMDSPSPAILLKRIISVYIVFFTLIASQLASADVFVNPGTEVYTGEAFSFTYTSPIAYVKEAGNSYEFTDGESITKSTVGVYHYQPHRCYIFGWCVDYGDLIEITVHPAPVACNQPEGSSAGGPPSGIFEFSDNSYQAYAGDVNCDGINDIYLKARPQIILLHGTIAIPIVTRVLPDLVLLGQGNDDYAAAQLWNGEILIDDFILNRFTVSANEMTGDALNDIVVNDPGRASIIAIIDANGGGTTFPAPTPTPTPLPTATASPSPTPTLAPVDPDYYVPYPDPEALIQPVHNPAVGALPGEHQIEFDGSASYSIPIDTDGSINGMAVGLSLSYSSNAGVSALGIGWTLNGLSSIQRCPPSKLRGEAHNPVDFDVHDKFCLDGQRLVLVAGAYGTDAAEYRKENDDGTKIFSNGQIVSGPASFTVWTGDGKVLQFGNSDLARVLASNNGSVISWALARSEDRFGNYVQINYEIPPGSNNHRVTQIDFAANEGAALSVQRSLRFNYLDGADRLQKSYMAGGYTTRDWLIENIKLYSLETPIRSFNMTYSADSDHSHKRLLSVEKCASGVCMPATTFQWSAESVGTETAVRAITNYASTFNHFSRDGKREQYLDLNGDGLADRIWTPYNHNDNIADLSSPIIPSTPLITISTTTVS
ncbi:MAG: hypothetical protein COA42_19395, partial [Alteromonadaceae bacterium]